jgi:hypothetical protein
MKVIYFLLGDFGTMRCPAWGPLNFVKKDFPCIGCLHKVSIDQNKNEVDCCWKEDAESMEKIRGLLK